MRAGILQSKEGVNGGMRMTKTEDNITLLDLLVAIENEKPLFQTEYELNITAKRPDSVKKTVNTILKNVEKNMKADLKKITLKDILNSI